MSTAKTVNVRTISPGFLFFLVLLVLKVTDVIALSWLWVCAPLWIPLAVAGALFVLAGLMFGAAKVIDKVAK